jgi:hypothetical protein
MQCQALRGENDMEGKTETMELVVQDLNILINAAEEMRNHFRAFERIKEIIQVLINADKILKELNGKADSVRVAVRQLETEKKILEEELGVTSTLIDQQREEERMVRGRITRAQSHLEEIREMIQRTLADTDTGS